MRIKVFRYEDIKKMVLERSIKGKKAKAVFYREFNDIDIYVEDTSVGVCKLYSNLFSRALAGRYRIETVFPLGDKLTVIKKCKEDQTGGGRLRLYIIDGDLDLLNGSNPRGLRRLFILNKYCIENYLIDERAIIMVLDEEDLEKQFEEIQGELDFNNWAESTERLLFDLFVLYAIANEVYPEYATVSFPVRRLVSSDQGTVDPAKVESRKRDLEEVLLGIIDSESLKNRQAAIFDKTNNYVCDKLRFISGKHYLLPLIIMRMRKITNYRAENRVLKQRLAMKCDVTELESASIYIT